MKTAKLCKQQFISLVRLNFDKIMYWLSGWKVYSYIYRTISLSYHFTLKYFSHYSTMLDFNGRTASLYRIRLYPLPIYSVDNAVSHFPQLFM